MDHTEKLNDQSPGPESAETYEERNASDTMATSSLSPIRGSNGYQQQIPIDATQPVSLSVTNASGEIRLIASDQENIWVVVRQVGDELDAENVGITIEVDGNTVSIHPDWQVMSGLSGLARRIRDQLKDGFNPDDWNLNKLKLNPNMECDIRIEVPRALAEGSRISLKTASGKVRVSGVRADLSAVSASGSIALQDLDGRIAAHTASGKVSIEDITGSLEVNTASGSIGVRRGEAWTALRSMSGSIKIGEFVMKNARLTTVSGSIQGDVVMNNAASYDLESVSGSVRLQVALPGDGGASLAFRSLSGSAHVDGDWVVASGKRSWQLPSGTEGPALRVKTVSGSLQLTGKTDTDVHLRNEPLPAAPEVDWHEDVPAHDDQEPLVDVEHSHGGPHGHSMHHRHDTDVEQHWDKAMGWVKEATRRIQEATDALGQTGSPRSEREHATDVTEPLQPQKFVPPVPPAPPATPPVPPTPPTSPAARVEETAEATAPIHAEHPAAAPPSEPTDTVPFSNRDATETAEQKRLRLLEAVERGEIDIDEALAQMDDDATPRA